MDTALMSKLFRVENPGPWATVTTTFPKWFDTVPDFEAHIKGDTRICRTPVGKDGTCYFGALDFDAKGDSPPIAAMNMYCIAIEHNLPINFFYSKSKKGAHGYVFSPSAIPASQMRAILRLYAWIFTGMLKKGNDIEIFPKQDELNDTNGNCINLPCHGDTCQPVVEKPIVWMNPMVPPPCLDDLPEKGNRNDFFYHLTVLLVYMEVKDPGKILSMINAHPDIIPLDTGEIKAVVHSAQRFMNRRREKGLGFGLGCNSCPAPRKSKCGFAGQQSLQVLNESVEFKIIVSNTSDSTIRIFCGGSHLDFKQDEIDNLRSIVLRFAIEKAIEFPIISSKDWRKFLLTTLASAPRVLNANPEDMSAQIMKALKGWARSFGDSMVDLDRGVPAFSGPDNVLVVPLDLHNRLMNLKIGGTLSAVVSTLGIYGEPVTATIGKIETIAYKVSRFTLGIAASDKATAIMYGSGDISDIDSIKAEPGETAKFFNDKGEWITFTNECLVKFPQLRQMMEENTLGKEFNPPLRFDDETH